MITFVNFLIILVITPNLAQIEVAKKCSSYPTLSNLTTLNSSKLIGQWFEIKQYNNYYETGQCIYYNFTIFGSKPKIIHSETTNNIIKNSTINKIIINGTSIIRADQGIFKNITILGIDYTDYAVAWACADTNTTYSKQLLWILSRNKTLTKKASESIDHILKLTTIKNDKINLKTIAHDKNTCSSGNNLLQFNFVMIAMTIFSTILFY